MAFTAASLEGTAFDEACLDGRPDVSGGLALAAGLAFTVDPPLTRDLPLRVPSP
jgi:hypothetical protein